jgi:hypothetical protein
MRNRNGFDHWEFMKPGEIYEVEVDLWSTSYIWNKGHRIRVAVSSSNYPRYLANPNTKDGINQNTGYSIAENMLYLSSDYPSCIILPRFNENYAPIKPAISGPAKGEPEITYTFTFNATDPNGEDIYYYIDWADGTNTGWLGPYSSGQQIALNHTWSTKQKFTIKAKAKDIHDDESEWSYHTISLPKSKLTLQSILLRLLERFPIVFKIIKALLRV